MKWLKPNPILLYIDPPATPLKWYVISGFGLAFSTQVTIRFGSGISGIPFIVRSQPLFSSIHTTSEFLIFVVKNNYYYAFLFIFVFLLLLFFFWASIHHRINYNKELTTITLNSVQSFSIWNSQTARHEFQNSKYRKTPYDSCTVWTLKDSWSLSLIHESPMWRLWI